MEQTRYIETTNRFIYITSVPICICNDNGLVFCDACKYWFYPFCMHVTYNFNSSFSFDFYV